MSSQTLPNMGLPNVVIPSPNRYVPPNWVNKPHPGFGFLEVQTRGGAEKGWLRFLHPQGFLLFGRDPAAAHIFVGHPSISNQHAVAAWDVRDGKCYIVDLESEHGTFVNDQVIEHTVPSELRPGDVVRYGQSAHVYKFDKLPEALVNHDLEAPEVGRPMDTRTEASQHSRYDDRFPERERFDARPEPPRQEFDRPPFESRPPPFEGRPPFDRPPPDMNRRPPPDMDRRPPPDMDRRPPPDMDRRPPQDMDRRPPQDMDRRPPPDMDRRPPPDMDRRPPPDMDRRPPDMDRRPPPPDRFRRGPPPDMDRGPPPGRGRGSPRDMGRGPPPHDMDRRLPYDMDRRDGPPRRGSWSPPNDRPFDDRHFEGRGRGMPPQYDDRGRFDGPPPPRSPPPLGPHSPGGWGRGGRSPRGRSPRMRPPRSPHQRYGGRGRSPPPPERDYRR